jgi:hypothetical protein
MMRREDELWLPSGGLLLRLAAALLFSLLRRGLEGVRLHGLAAPGVSHKTPPCKPSTCPHDDASDSEDAVGCAQMAAGSAAEVEIRQESLPLVILKGNSLGVEGLAAVLSALRPDASGCLDLSDNELGDTGCHLLAQQGESRPLLAILNAFLESCVAVVSD